MHPEYGLDFRYQLYDDVAWIGAMDSTSPQTIQPMKECVADLLFAFFFVAYLGDSRSSSSYHRVKAESTEQVLLALA